MSHSQQAQQIHTDDLGAQVPGAASPPTSNEATPINPPFLLVYLLPHIHLDLWDLQALQYTGIVGLSLLTS